MTTNDLITRLAKLDTPAVSDALDQLELQGRVTGLARLSTERRIAGRVLTVRLGADAPGQGPLRHLCTAAVEAGGPGDVIAIEQRTGIEAAGWGGILSNGARLRGIEGVICDGPVRDVDESRSLDFPVFARRAIPTSARKRIFEQAFNEPVTIGEVTVSAGDFALADASGVCFLAAARAEDILDAAETIAGREAAMTRAVLAGEPISRVMGADYERMLDRN